MMAVGETLQGAVDSDRVCKYRLRFELGADSDDMCNTAFKDDICGVSLSIRFNSYLVSIWNRDGDHQEGIAQILKTVMSEVPEEMRPKEGSYFYKKHSEHAGFKGAKEPAINT
jgi:hypothetical protein